MLAALIILSASLALYSFYDRSPAAKARQGSRKTVQKLTALNKSKDDILDLAEKNYAAAVESYVESVRTAFVAAIPLTAVRKVEPGVRLQPLLDAGVTSLAQCEGWTASMFERYRGIGAGSALRIASACRRAATQARSQPVPLPTLDLSRPEIRAICSTHVVRVKYQKIFAPVSSTLPQALGEVVGLQKTIEQDTTWYRWLLNRKDDPRIMSAVALAAQLETRMSPGGDLQTIAEVAGGAIVAAQRNASQGISLAELESAVNGDRKNFLDALAARLAGKTAKSGGLAVQVGTAVSPPILGPSMRQAEPPVIETGLTWHSWDESMVIAGQKIEHCQFYTSHGCTIEPSAINLSLAIKLGPSPLQTWGYWPSYETIPADQRGCYIKWLVAGRPTAESTRHDPGPQFLYFYGLERRFFIDNDRTEKLADSVREILGQTGSKSLVGYFSQFLHFRAATLGANYYLHNLVGLLHSSQAGVGSDELLLIYGALYGMGQGLPPEVAFLAVQRATGALYCTTELRRLGSDLYNVFQVRYTNSFPGGITLKAGAGQAKITYRPASRSIMATGGAQSLALETRRIGIEPKHLGKLVEIWNGAASQLRKYNRILAKSDETEFNPIAFAALPIELRAREAGYLGDQWKTFLDSHAKVDDAAVATAESVATFFNLKVSERFSVVQGETTATLVRAFGYEPVPSAADFGGRWRSPQEVALVPRSLVAELRPSAGFLGVAALIQLAAFVATSGGPPAPSQTTQLDLLLATPGLSASETVRLKALLGLLLRSPTNSPRNVAEVARSVAIENAASVARAVARVIASGRTLSKTEERAFFRITTLLGVPRALGQELLEAAGEVPESVAVAGVQSKKGEKLPARPTGTGFKLDLQKVDAIAAETREVISILSKVMEEDEASTVSTNAAPARVANNTDGLPAWTRGLDAKMAQPLVELIGQSEWSKADFGRMMDRHHLVPGAFIDAVNEWSDDALGDFLVSGDDPIIIQTTLLSSDQPQVAES